MSTQDRDTKNWNDTAGARAYAAGTEHTITEVDAHWWSVFTGYRQKQWRAELKQLMNATGINEEKISEYTGLAYSPQRTPFVVRPPKKREAYIGIGMALKQPLETINRWIGKYGGKRQLYVKDITEDLIWIYLIQANLQDQDSNTNYYRMFDRCADAVYQTYCALWEDYIAHNTVTAQVAEEIQRIPFDEDFIGLQEYVIDHLDTFKTAYAKPRRMLAERVDLILDGMNRGKPNEARQLLSQLRGYLEDSMINYLAGDPETIHVSSRAEEGKHLLQLKSVPKGRRAHISLALALGMNREEIDRYLDLMGFLPLDAIDRDEGILISALQHWDEAHPLVQQLRQQGIGGKAVTGTDILSDTQIRMAVQQMLQLREDIGEDYTVLGKTCPYLKA